MTERDEQVFTIFKNKDTGEINIVADVAFLQTAFGLKLYKLTNKAKKSKII